MRLYIQTMYFVSLLHRIRLSGFILFYFFTAGPMATQDKEIIFALCFWNSASPFEDVWIFLYSIGAWKGSDTEVPLIIRN